MNITACIHGCRPLPNNRLSLTLEVEAESGERLATSIETDFAGAHTTINAAAEAGARQALKDVFGLTLTTQDKVRVFGGAVN